MQIPIGVQVSLGYKADGITETTDPAQMVWYKLTDHNRQPIKIAYDLIENTQRMADGNLRKYVVARKFKITTDWQNLPTLDSDLVDYSDGAHGGSWIKAFYEANNFVPVWVKLVFAQHATPDIFQVPVNSTYFDSRNTTAENSVYHAYMSSFDYEILKRRTRSATQGISGSQGFDYVNLRIEFTEI